MAPMGQVKEGQAASGCLLDKCETGTSPGGAIVQVREAADVGTPQRPLQAARQHGSLPLKPPGSQLPLHILPVVPGDSEYQRVFCPTQALPEAHPAEAKLGS